MEVRQGISTDYAKERFDISLDETDLARLALEFGIEVYQVRELTTLQACKLLTLDAERFVLIQAPKYGRDTAVVREQLRSNREQFAHALATLKGTELETERKHLGLPPEKEG
jgi:hypothetical protein